MITVKEWNCKVFKRYIIEAPSHLAFSMRNILATVVDGLWLHISLRIAGEFGGTMIKEGLGAYSKKKKQQQRGVGGIGNAASAAAKKRLDPQRDALNAVNPLRTINIALCFDSAAHAEIVREQFEKRRGKLRKRCVEQTTQLFKWSAGESLSSRKQISFSNVNANVGVATNANI